ncbi:atp-dependent rna [Nannochloropsis gaditana CCMP526]|uniref:atp-dependent rna n=1 Tax=Nannochloropsis gaditana (strain CCMP526) TaxID=1093141 RepID=UPI00029F5D5E|nr:atp-dependent rna [Nannochloropsis gaditana CCMP526]EKU21547.1 atp-dependent rna [Nannochloropsis gaditana CCMP526]|eukprot:XP_005854811.1 atp-dependent rna [Nannochloropsis gaditana CCMP526]
MTLAAALGQDEEGGGDAIISAKNAGQGGIRRKRDSRGNLIEPEALQDARKMSKSMKKRMAQISLRKEKEARRANLYQTLARQALDPSLQTLFLSSKGFSHGKESLKIRLGRALERQRAGLPVEDEEAAMLLYRERATQEEGEGIFRRVGRKAPP